MYNLTNSLHFSHRHIIDSVHDGQLNFVDDSSCIIKDEHDVHFGNLFNNSSLIISKNIIMN